MPSDALDLPGLPECGIGVTEMVTMHGNRIRALLTSYHELGAARPLQGVGPPTATLRLATTTEVPCDQALERPT